jgi:ketosteroid isomerase-like protein
MSTAAIISHLTALEKERCRCIVDQRYDDLALLLSERLIHTHTRGNHDDKSSYLAYIGGVIEVLDLQREELRVVPLGDTAALMHGKQVNRARKRGAPEELRIEASVTQTWFLESDMQWRMVAFHASSLGPLPPSVR